MSDQPNNQAFFPFSGAMTADLESRLRRLLENFSSDAAQIAGTVSLLVAKHSEKHRFYHNLSHVSSLLANAGDFRNRFEDYPSVQLAVWFHDAIYEPAIPDNELKSARLAVERLSGLDVPRRLVDKVEKMILATERHSAAGLDEDGRLLLDLDLAILGAAPRVYETYARAIRAEYSHVPDDLYRRGRSDVLRRFLDREFIYYTGGMRRSHEEQARLNIENELKELS